MSVYRKRERYGKSPTSINLTLLTQVLVYDYIVHWFYFVVSYTEGGGSFHFLSGIGGDFST